MTKLVNEAIEENAVYCISRLLKLDKKHLESIDGEPALMLAARLYDDQIFRLMIQAGLNPNIYSESNISLHWLCNSVWVSKSKMLLLLGHPDLDINALVYDPYHHNCLQLTTRPMARIKLYLAHPQARLMCSRYPATSPPFHLLKVHIADIGLAKQLLVKAYDERRAFALNHTSWSSLGHYHCQHDVVGQDHDDDHDNDDAGLNNDDDGGESDSQITVNINVMIKHQSTTKRIICHDETFCNQNLTRLLQKYRQDNSVIHQWKAEVKEVISYLFTVTTLVNDSYLRLKDGDDDGDGSEDEDNLRVGLQRWFSITNQLPLEVNMLLCHYDNLTVTSYAAICTDNIHIHSLTVRQQATSILRDFH